MLFLKQSVLWLGNEFRFTQVMNSVLLMRHWQVQLTELPSADVLCRLAAFERELRANWLDQSTCID
jgi:hypothetical protein